MTAVGEIVAVGGEIVAVGGEVLSVEMAKLSTSLKLRVLASVL